MEAHAPSNRQAQAAGHPDHPRPRGADGCGVVLEPIFEADLQPEQFAYRPERSALDAVRAVHKHVNTGHTEVVDADLSGYYDSIPHAELMKSVARRISDRHLLHLLKMWLVAPVEETDGRGRTHRRTRNKDTGRVTFRVRTRESFSESRMRENRTSGSMSGMWKQSMDELVRHRQTKESDNR